MPTLGCSPTPDQLAARAKLRKAWEGERLTKIRNQMMDLADSLCSQCPASRELDKAVTKLEEAMFWANASIARAWP